MLSREDDTLSREDNALSQDAWGCEAQLAVVTEEAASLREERDDLAVQNDQV